MSSLDEAKAGEAAAIDAINKLVAEVQRLGAKITGQAPPPATDADLTQLATDLQNVAKTGTDAVTASQTAVP